MKIFFDENFSPFIAKGMAQFESGPREDPVEVLHVLDQFPRGTPDEELIPKIAQKHGVLITKDFNIARTQMLSKLCRDYKLALIIFRPPSKKGVGHWDWVLEVVNNWKKIKAEIKRSAPPYTIEIKARSFRRY